MENGHGDYVPDLRGAASPALQRLGPRGARGGVLTHEPPARPVRRPLSLRELRDGGPAVAAARRRAARALPAHARRALPRRGGGSQGHLAAPARRDRQAGAGGPPARRRLWARTAAGRGTPPGLLRRGAGALPTRLGTRPRRARP